MTTSPIRTLRRFRNLEKVSLEGRKQQDAAEKFTNVVNTIHHYEEGFTGKGIVICGGGRKYFPLAHTAIYTLRQLGCTLPIELWSMKNEAINTNLLKDLNIQVCNSQFHMPGFVFKVHAILRSGFEEIIFIDSDNLPIKDPSFFFDCPQYKEFHAIFWQDISGTRAFIRPHTYELAGIEESNRENWSFESGQLVINKRECWHELQCTWHLNENNSFWYKQIYGDKDTFKLAWHRCHRKYVTPKMPIWKAPAIIQYDFNGNEFWYHCCRGKRQLETGQIIPILPSHLQTCVSEARKLRINQPIVPPGRFRDFKSFRKYSDFSSRT